MNALTQVQVGSDCACSLIGKNVENRGKLT
jgi:hypothetical protein